MQGILALISNLNWQEWLLAVQGLLVAVIGVAVLIPGEQPEKFLQGVVDFIKGISKK